MRPIADRDEFLIVEPSTLPIKLPDEVLKLIPSKLKFAIMIYWVLDLVFLNKFYRTNIKLIYLMSFQIIRLLKIPILLLVNFKYNEKGLANHQFARPCNMIQFLIFRIINRFDLFIN